MGSELVVLLVIVLAVAVVLLVVSSQTKSHVKRPSVPQTTRSQASLQRSSQRHEPDDAGEALAALFLLVGAAWLGGKVLKAGFAFLKDVDWDQVGSELKEAIERAAIEVDRQPNVAARLDRAEQLLMSGGEINVDQAAMLTSATPELGLRTLAKRCRVTVSQENDSLAGLAITLGQAGHIAFDEQRQIQHYAANIRNVVVHGRGVMNAPEVASFHSLARRCLMAHRIA